MEKLSNKTKAQLLEIIERKDAVERELRDVNKTLNGKIEHLNGKIEHFKSEIDNFDKIYNNSLDINKNLKADLEGTEKELNKTREECKLNNKLYNKAQSKLEHLDIQYNILKNDYENICDTLAIERVEHKNCKFSYISAIIILIIVLFCAIIHIYNI